METNESSSVDVRLVQRGTFARGWRKYLLVTRGLPFEAWAYRGEKGWEIGFSCQIGCPVGCKFCATGQSGFVRDLTVDEIDAQIKLICDDVPGPVSALSAAAQGEPLLCEPAVRQVFARYEGLARSVATCGVPQGVKAIANWGFSCDLSVTLHSVFQETRDKLMPGTTQWPLETLRSALNAYNAAKCGRLTLAVGLAPGVNDGWKSLDALGAFGRELAAPVRLGVLDFDGGSILAQEGDLPAKCFETTGGMTFESSAACISAAAQYLRGQGVSVQEQEPLPRRPISLKRFAGRC